MVNGVSDVKIDQLRFKLATYKYSRTDERIYTEHQLPIVDIIFPGMMFRETSYCEITTHVGGPLILATKK